MTLAKLSLSAVVFIDTAGQGLIFPIVVTLLTRPEVGFLPAGTAQGTRQLYYGITIGVFFLAWFLGSVYIARLSDSIGRKWGIELCLAGTLAGYVTTIVAIASGSLWLLLAGRAVTGFASGNQPIAQAAMSDLSRNDEERARNMGLIVTGLSLGMVGGPIIGGIFSDHALLGAAASLSLPFYIAAAIVIAAMVLIAVGFKDPTRQNAPLRIGPFEIFALLWSATRRPTVMRISAVFFTYMLAMLAFYIFMDDFLSRRFGFDTFHASLTMLVFGIALALTSSLLVGPTVERATKQAIVIGATVTMAASAAVFAATPWPLVCYLALVPFGIAQGVGYPTMLTIFSNSVGEDEQGWVMGVSTALWTLGAGLISLTGGSLMAIAIAAPLMLTVLASVVTLALIAVLWRTVDLRAIVAI